ncbi:GIY-YIG nuclease family protein, partial [Microbacteriaceae bacterium K1510]|nr:GIY-YIG nuclease family protein [Microbacteriaceae bacterium K1510]
VYIVRCSDDTYYTGYTTELLRRMQTHNEGKGAKYTRGRGPVELMYIEEGSSHSWGLKREEEIKRFSRERKERLIREGSPCSGTEQDTDTLHQSDQHEAVTASQGEKGGISRP